MKNKILLEGLIILLNEDGLRHILPTDVSEQLLGSIVICLEAVTLK